MKCDAISALCDNEHDRMIPRASLESPPAKMVYIALQRPGQTPLPGRSGAIHCASEHQSPRSGARRVRGASQSAQSAVRADAVQVSYIYTTTLTLQL